jgi:hypothetical protein
MANISVRNRTAPTPSRRRAAARRAGDASASLIIAPTSISIAAVLAWWALTLVPGAGIALVSTALLWFWAGVFALVAGRALYVLLREIISR